MILRVAGGVVATGLGLALGLYSAYYAPLYFPGTAVRAPLALGIALVGNPLLAWYAFRVTGRRWAVVLPAVPWCAIWITASTKTTEGDLLVPSGNWVGLATLLLGPTAFAAGAYWAFTRTPPAPADELPAESAPAHPL